MQNFLFFILAIVIAIYCGYHAKVNFNEKNNLGGIAISVLSLLSIASPIAILYFM